MSSEINIDDTSGTSSRGPDNKQQYRIRAMCHTDIKAVAAIDESTWQDESWSIETFSTYVDNPRWNCWILESTDHDRTIIGHGHQRSIDGISHIANICIHPDRRGCGFGRELLRFMIEFARQKGASLVQLEVKATNRRAYKLYVDHGFRTVGYIQQYYRDHSTAYQMKLMLRKE